MDFQLLTDLSQYDRCKTVEILNLFLKESEKKYGFPELNEENIRKNIWLSLCKLASISKDTEVLIKTFSAIRLLSRDKTHLDDLITEINCLDIIKSYCLSQEIIFNKEKNVLAIESEKCLCNIVFNSRNAAGKCWEMQILTNIMDRITLYKDQNFPIDLKILDMKLCFIMTALLSHTKRIISEEQNGIEKLCTVLYNISEKISLKNNPESEFLNEQEMELLSEVLKALFNLTIQSDINELEKLLTALRVLLLAKVSSEEKSLILHNHIVNLLTNIPDRYYEHLVPPIQNSNNTTQYDGLDMSAIEKMISLLKYKLHVKKTAAEDNEILSPLLTVLLRACSNRNIRKYLRLQILPPLKDVHKKPEEGDTLRNRLCKLLTNPSTQLKEVTAEFLFILCKKNVGRMIKYTGYGNAAGLFAQKGLLGGSKNYDTAGFSSEDEDSETEEYSEFKNHINPVLGCFEPPRPNAMANMTEEQKEYEAMKLVELIDSMTKIGSIKPCTIGKDGKPQPIEHVLQLQEGLKGHQLNNDTDSD